MTLALETYRSRRLTVCR